MFSGLHLRSSRMLPCLASDVFWSAMVNHSLGTTIDPARASLPVYDHVLAFRSPDRLSCCAGPLHRSLFPMVGPFASLGFGSGGFCSQSSWDASTTLSERHGLSLLGHGPDLAHGIKHLGPIVYTRSQSVGCLATCCLVFY